MFSSRNKCLKTTFWSYGKAALLFLNILILSGGCTVGPQFAKPAVTINQVWSVPDTSPLFVIRNKPDSAWWTTFGDPVLDSLVSLASRQNLNLQKAGLRIMEARAQMAVSIGRQFPQVQAALGNVTATGVSRDISEALGINRNFLNYQVGFDVSWEADFWGKYLSEVKAQRSTLLGTEADYDHAQVSLIAEVAHTYTSIRTYQVLIKLAHRNIQLQSNGLQIAESRFKNGVSPELDVIQATTLLESTKASIPQLELNLIQSGNALSTLLGQPSENIQGLLQDSGYIPVAPSKVAIVLPAQLLQRRPDILSAQLLAEAQCARIGIAKSELYPKILLSGMVGTQTSSGLGLQTSNLFTGGSVFYAIGPRLVWQILNYGRSGNKIRAEDARLQQLLSDYENTVLKAVNEVEDGLSGYLKSREAAVSAQNAANNAQRSVDLSFDLYREGAADYQRVLEAQRSLLQEENALTQANAAIINTLISLYKALGGGWELSDGQPIVNDSTRIEMQRRTNWGDLIPKPETPVNSETYTPNHR